MPIDSLKLIECGSCDGAVELDSQTKGCLQDPRSMKYMSKQDKMAVVAATELARKVGLTPSELESSGLYAAIGVLPFEKEVVSSLAQLSQVDGEFNMEAFSGTAFQKMNPLLTFKCLPNMPVFHVSWNLGIRGRYFISYPGPGQWALALARAMDDLRQGLVSHAFVGAVADQNNYLVQNLYQRLEVQTLTELNNAEKDEPEANDINRLADRATFWLLTKENINYLPLATILNLEIGYEAQDPFCFSTASFYQPPFVFPEKVIGERTNGIHRFAGADGFKCQLEVEFHR